MNSSAKLHAILVLLVLAATASVAGGIFVRVWVLRALLVMLAAWFILGPSMICFRRAKNWVRIQRGL